jgi:predicted NodU family carbamoyl transferase
VQEGAGPFEAKEIDNVYWGPEYSAHEIDRAINSEGYNVERHENIEEQIARLLPAEV